MYASIIFFLIWWELYYMPLSYLYIPNPLLNLFRKCTDITYLVEIWLFKLFLFCTFSQDEDLVTDHRRLCRVKNMLAMYLKYHKAGLTRTTPVTSIAISPVKMSIGRKSLTNLRSEMIFLQGKPVFYIFLPSTPPY